MEKRLVVYALIRTFAVESQDSRLIITLKKRNIMDDYPAETCKK